MATQPTKWSIQIGVNSEKATIPVSAGADNIDLSKLYPSAYELPLDAGGQAVGRTEMNTLFSMLFENVYFQQQGGIYEYSASIDYTVGTRVLYNGEIYKCIQNNGISSTVVAPTNSAYWDRFLLLSDLSLVSVVPTGVILPYGGVTAPTGFLLCDYSAVSRTTYANLFAAIGTRYGAGDGSTTFNVPKLNDGSFVRGVSSGSVGTNYSAALPPFSTNSAGDHTHTRGTMEITGAFNASMLTDGYATVSGAFVSGGAPSRQTPACSADQSQSGFSFKASNSWSGATSSNGAHTHTITNSAGVAMNGNTVLPQSVGCNYIIKI